VWSILYRKMGEMDETFPQVVKTASPSWYVNTLTSKEARGYYSYYFQSSAGVPVLSWHKCALLCQFELCSTWQPNSKFIGDAIPTVYVSPNAYRDDHGRYAEVPGRFRPCVWYILMELNSFEDCLMSRAANWIILTHLGKISNEL